MMIAEEKSHINRLLLEPTKPNNLASVGCEIEKGQFSFY
jgi:hypothetical protein